MSQRPDIPRSFDFPYDPNFNESISTAPGISGIFEPRRQEVPAVVGSGLRQSNLALPSGSRRVRTITDDSGPGPLTIRRPAPLLSTVNRAGISSRIPIPTTSAHVPAVPPVLTSRHAIVTSPTYSSVSRQPIIELDDEQEVEETLQGKGKGVDPAERSGDGGQGSVPPAGDSGGSGPPDETGDDGSGGGGGSGGHPGTPRSGGSHSHPTGPPGGPGGPGGGGGGGGGGPPGPPGGPGDPPGGVPPGGGQGPFGNQFDNQQFFQMMGQSAVPVTPL